MIFGEFTRASREKPPQQFQRRFYPTKRGKRLNVSVCFLLTWLFLLAGILILPRHLSHVKFNYLDFYPDASFEGLMFHRYWGDVTVRLAGTFDGFVFALPTLRKVLLSENPARWGGGGGGDIKGLY